MWRAPHEESLCLVIVDRPEVKRCWENYSQGTYSIELIFNEDLIFQLKDPQLQHPARPWVVRVFAPLGRRYCRSAGYTRPNDGARPRHRGLP